MEESTLIIWEEIPDNTRFFLIPNSIIAQVKRPNLLKIITSANGYFVNCEDEEYVLQLQSFLFDEEGNCLRTELETKSEKGKLVFDNVLITRVCHTGFAL